MIACAHDSSPRNIARAFRAQEETWLGGWGKLRSSARGASRGSAAARDRFSLTWALCRDIGSRQRLLIARYFEIFHEKFTKADLSDVVESAPTGPLAVPALDTAELSLSLIVPTFNESENVRNLVAALTRLLDARLGADYEIIVVDDDSPDKTWQLAARLMPEYPRLRVVRRQNERGLSSAVIRGWQLARGSMLGVIDGDLQHPPELVLTLWDKLSEGADLAVASRNVKGGGVSDWSIRRRILSRGAQVIGLTVLYSVVSRVSDPMSGYFMLRRSVIAGKSLSPVGYKILLEVLGRGAAERVTEAGYVFRERAEGKTKITWLLYLHYLQHLLRLRADRRAGSK